jgi:hypothetical protein
VAKGSYSIAADGKVTVRVPLNSTGKKLVKELLSGPNPAKRFYGQFVLQDSGQQKGQTSQRSVRLPKGK